MAPPRKKKRYNLTPEERARRSQFGKEIVEVLPRDPATGQLQPKDAETRAEKQRREQAEEDAQHREILERWVNGWGNAEGRKEALLLPMVEAKGFETVEAYMLSIGATYDPPWRRSHPDWDGPPDIDTALERIVLRELALPM